MTLRRSEVAPSPRSPFGFPKSGRLLSRRDFARMRRAAVRLETASFRLALRRSEGGAPRLGLAVSRKVGTAVVRNRIKRCVREVFRQLALPAVDVLVMAKPGAALLGAAGRDAVRDELTAPLVRAAGRTIQREARSGRRDR